MWGTTHVLTLFKSAKTHLATTAALALSVNMAAAADLDKETEVKQPVLKYPLIEGSFVFELENDYVFSDQSGDELNNTFNTTEVSVDFRLNDILSLHTDITLEPVDNIDPVTGNPRAEVPPRTLGENIFFEDHGFFFETLHLQADLDNFSFFGGKINPTFGTAWDVTPGIYGVDFAEDYELTERIGLGGAYTFKSDKIGEYTLTASAFFADTTGLSRSFGTNRGRTTRAAGGASNTETPNNFSVTLDGAELPALPGFSYHLGIRYQQAGLGDFGDDFGFVAGAIKEFDLSDALKLSLNGEVAYFNNFDGGNTDNLYATIGAALEYEKWFGNAAFSVRDINSNVNAGDFTDLNFQAGIGREVFENASFEVGYRFTRDGGNNTHTIGALFVYETDFKISRR